MSVKIMGLVWDLDLPHHQQSILLAMADHADHEGNRVFPSVGLVAWKTGYSPRQVIRVIKELVAIGLLVLVDERKGRSKGYSINISAGKVKEPYRATPDKMSDGVRHSYVTP